MVLLSLNGRYYYCLLVYIGDILDECYGNSESAADCKLKHQQLQQTACLQRKSDDDKQENLPQSSQTLQHQILSEQFVIQQTSLESVERQSVACDVQVERCCDSTHKDSSVSLPKCVRPIDECDLASSECDDVSAAVHCVDSQYGKNIFPQDGTAAHRYCDLTTERCDSLSQPCQQSKQMPPNSSRPCDVPLKQSDIPPTQPTVPIPGLQCDKSHSWRSVVILIPMRLGGESANPLYIPVIKTFLSMNQCIGLIGGKPKHSLYFIGWQG